jgi:hypothetical protein
MKAYGILSVALLLAANVASAGPPVVDAGPAFAGARVDTLERSTLDRPGKVQLKSDMAALGTPEIAGMREWQRKKSARVAIFSSMLVPGLGQTYNGRRIKTAIMVGLATFYANRAITENRHKVARRKVRDTFPPGSLSWKEENLFVEFHRETSLDFVWFSGAAWLIGVLDAFVDAHLFDVRSVDPAIIHSSNNNYVGLGVKF